jgi:parvulin-like peptidyl-prolyl isomerase
MSLWGNELLAERVLVDRVVAVVDQNIITERELEAKAATFLSALDPNLNAVLRAAKRREILQKVLEIEVGERIVNVEVAKSRDKLGVTSKDVDRAVEEVLRINSMDRDRLQAALYSQGLTWKEYRSKLKSQIERARFIQFKMQGKVNIRPADTKQRCLERQSADASGDKVCASHILLKVPEDATRAIVEKLRIQALNIQAEVSSGADFAGYALKYSQDTSTPDGQLGCFGRGEMLKSFEDAAYNTPAGEVSPAVRTEFGFHVIRVWERQSPASPCKTQEDLSPFQNELYQEKMESETHKLIRDLRKKSFVEIRSEYAN